MFSMRFQRPINCNSFVFFCLEDVYCTDAVNATEDSPEFAQCAARAYEKRADEEAKQRWLWIVCSLGTFFIAFICKRLLFQLLKTFFVTTKLLLIYKN